MPNQMGNPFQQITGPGVWIVSDMTELENKLRKLGFEVEYSVRKDDEQFTWPPQQQAKS